MAKGKLPDDLMGGLQKPRKLGVFGWLRGRFFAGMVIAAPLAATFFILEFLIGFIDAKMRPLIPAVIKNVDFPYYAIPGFGVLVLVIALTLLGAITANLVGRSLLSATDRILSRIPIVKNVYAAIKQLTEVLANNKEASFDRVVMVEYPKADSWCLAFVSSNAGGEIGAKLGTDRIGVFVPTTPNPTSGFLMYVDPSKCIEMDMSIEDAAKMILTGGLVIPDYKPKASVAEGEVGAEQLAEQS